MLRAGEKRRKEIEQKFMREKKLIDMRQDMTVENKWNAQRSIIYEEKKMESIIFYKMMIYCI